MSNRRIVLLFMMLVAGMAGAQESQLRLSELLFNPRVGGADFVELYNPGPEPVSLKRVRLAQWKNDAVSKLYPIDTARTMQVGEYLVVTTDAAYVKGNYRIQRPDWIVEVKSMPSYNDANGTLMLTLADTTLLERFDYTEKMHSRLLADVEGVSLERRSYSADANAANNWQSASSTSGYATPTAPNSQSTEFLFREDEFHYSAEVFSPDGDGVDDLLDITYRLTDGDLTANIDIYDGSGRLMRHLAQSALLGTEGVVSWDGTDQQGHRCHRGNYIVRIEAFTAQGHKQVSKKVIALVTK